MLVAKSIIPPEAHEIARQFRQAANELRSSSGNLNSIGATLDSDWLGHSKELFFDLFRSQPSAVSSMADWLLNCANYIESIHVTIYVEVPDNLG